MVVAHQIELNHEEESGTKYKIQNKRKEELGNSEPELLRFYQDENYKVKENEVERDNCHYDQSRFFLGC